MLEYFETENALQIVDRVPNELFRTFMRHYASNFDNIFDNIPFYVEWESDGFGYTDRVRDVYGNLVFTYDNIRMFLITAR